MFLRKDVFTEFRLDIASYQFPYLKDWYDGNWLNVSVRVKHSNGDWQKTDPSLEAFELKRLIKWFEKISRNEDVENEIYFTEPCLAFEFIKQQKQKTIRVFLSNELKPSWEKDEEEFSMDFVVTDKELFRVIEDLQKDLEKFPIRGKNLNE